MDRNNYNSGGGRTGGDGGRGRGCGGNSQNQQSGNYQQQKGRGGDCRNNQNRNRKQAGYKNPPPAPVQQWGPRPVQDQGGAHPRQGGRGRPTTGRTWGPTPRPGGDATETQIQTSQLVTDISISCSTSALGGSCCLQGSYVSRGCQTAIPCFFIIFYGVVIIIMMFIYVSCFI